MEKSNGNRLHGKMVGSTYVVHWEKIGSCNNHNNNNLCLLHAYKYLHSGNAPLLNYDRLLNGTPGAVKIGRRWGMYAM